MTMTLRVGRTMDRCRVLGPGVRAVIWVTGCPLRCRECIAPEFLDPRAGRDVGVATLAEWILGLDGIDGVTFSGGEPFEQAGPLSTLVDLIRASDPSWSAMAFTGYTVERLARAGTSAQRALLKRLDIVVDGPYVPARHSAHRWRGSENQRIHIVSDRHSPDLAEPAESVGIEVVVDADGGFAVAGVPPSRGFRGALETRLREQGVIATTEEEG